MLEALSKGSDIWFWLNAASLVFGLIIIPGIGYLWLRRLFCNDNSIPDLKQIPEILDEPPDNLPPAIVALLLGRSENGMMMTATLFDLLRRGILQIEEVKENGNLESKKILIFHKVKKAILFSFEEYVVTAFASCSGKILSFTKSNDIDLNDFRMLVEKEAINLGLSLEKPSKTTIRFILGVIFPLFLVSLVGGLFAVSRIDILELGWVPSLSLLVVATIALILSGKLAKKTAKGIKETL